MRAGCPESVHAVAACVSDGDGRVSLETFPGAHLLPVFARSAAKPLQALPSAAAAVLEALGLDDRHLAVACASHRGAAHQVALVQEILAAAGLDESALGGPARAPLGPDVGAELAARGESPRPVHDNCSGNHALGLALCVRSGWPVHGYLDPRHPLQDAMRDWVRRATGASTAPEGVDGCGMRAYRVSLGGLAAAFGRLACAAPGSPEAMVAGAMRAHPELVHGAGGIDSALMAAVPGLVAKLGAEGVIAVGLRDGRGLCVKILDGGRRALDPAAVAAVREGLGVTPAGPGLDRLARPRIVVLGQHVGDVEARVPFVTASGS
jgi:L-asparaginase II